MSHQTLPLTTSSARNPNPSRSSHDQTPTDAGSFVFLGGVVIVALLAIMIWLGLF